MPWDKHHCDENETEEGFQLMVVVTLEPRQANHHGMCESNHLEDKSLKVASNVEREWYGFFYDETCRHNDQFYDFNLDLFNGFFWSVNSLANYDHDCEY
jgi:hypothetical protein